MSCAIWIVLGGALCLLFMHDALRLLMTEQEEAESGNWLIATADKWVLVLLILDSFDRLSVNINAQCLHVTPFYSDFNTFFFRELRRWWVGLVKNKGTAWVRRSYAKFTQVMFSNSVKSQWYLPLNVQHFFFFVGSKAYTRNQWSSIKVFALTLRICGSKFLV